MCFRKYPVNRFELSDYQYYIDNFPSERILGKINNSKDAAKKAENVWIELYGEDIKNEKPYQIFYNSQNDVWLIQGSLPPNTLGGVANILIEGSTGKTLAVWHDK